MKLINFKGLYGEDNFQQLPNFIHQESLETRSKMYNWEINEHIHSELFQLFILKKGSGILISGKQKIELNSPCIITIPSNTLHGFGFDFNVQGEVITFSESYLETILKNAPNILLNIDCLRQIHFIENTVAFDQLSNFITQIIAELNEDLSHKNLTVQALFQLFFTHIYRINILQNGSKKDSDNRTLRHFQAFQKLIRQSIQETKPVNEYAKDLNITPVHLNRICQAIVQKSALQIVNEYLIEEAKKYLLNTDYSITEISYFLNFNDPAYFTRLFKKMTNFSPSKFREKIDFHFANRLKKT
jgi:AraC family transcriptional regulator, transcriptional activator of pobA